METEAKIPLAQVSPERDDPWESSLDEKPIKFKAIVR